MNNFQLCFRFHLALCPVLPAVLIISRGSVDDFETNTDDTGVEYFTFVEKRTKTRNTGLKPSFRQSIPKMFATGGEKCIVQIFKTYVSRRPEALRDSGPFYLQPLSNPRGITWFKRVPLGENSILCPLLLKLF